MPLPFVDVGPLAGHLDPAFRYPLDEASGITTFRDMGGLGGKNPGYLGGSLGQGGGAAPGTKASTYFGGAGYVNIGSAYTNALWLLYGVTISAWIYRAANTPPNQINPIMTIGPWSFVFQCGHHGALPFSTQDTMWVGFVNSNGNWDGVLDNNGPLPLNTWTHVACTWDSYRLGVYRNGWDTASSSGVVGPTGNTGGAMIGCYPDGSSWRMTGFYLADVRYYPYRLYDGDMMALYNSYFTPPAATWVRGKEPENLVMHLPLDRANVRDAVGGAVTAAGSGYADGGAGSSPFPGAASMGSTYFGSGAYLLVRGYPANALSTNWTMAAWVYPTSTAAGRCIMTKRYNGAGGRIPMVLGYGNEFGTLANAPWVGFYNPGWYGCGDTTALPLNQWSHVAGSFDGSTFRIYRNGVLTNFGGGPAPGGYTDDDFVIGHRWDGFAGAGFPGYISDARVYNQVLNDAQVKSIYDRAVGNQRNWMPLGSVT